MKKILLLMANASFAFSFANAQNTFPSSGNVGIGTTNPQNKLSVYGNASFGAIDNGYPGPSQYGVLNFPRGQIIFSNTNTQNQLYLVSNGYISGGSSFAYNNNNTGAGIGIDDGSVSIFTAPSGTAGSNMTFTNRLTVVNGGNVGIGTSSPLTKLQVIGSGGLWGNIATTVTPAGYTNGISSGLGYALNSSTSFTNHGAMSNIGLLQKTADANDINAGVYLSIHGWYQNSATSLPIAIGGGYSNFIPALYITAAGQNGGGNVGIGTTNPDQKLSVAGTIHAQSVKVDMNGWSDIVFSKNYKLLPLKTVASFVEKNQHLPEIPSEQEVIKNGVDIGEINKKMLQKIEELTLYLLDQQKQINKLKKQLQLDRKVKQNND